VHHKKSSQLRQALSIGAVVTRPRRVLPDQFYLVTRRCIERRFLLRPDKHITNAIAYCMADAAKRSGVIVLLSTVESNHHHTVIYDRYGRFPKFIEHFHKMVAKCVNAARGRRENLWASTETCVTQLLDYETILDKLAYVAANPAKDDLVERSIDWPGLNGYRHLRERKTLRATRPSFFFRSDRGWPDELDLTFTIPPELGDIEEVLAELDTRVAALEAEARRRRNAANKKVLGTAGILKQRWNASSTSVEAPRVLRPRYAGRRDTRIEALQEFRSFLVAYREARLCWIAGKSCLFPAGTYWIARHTPLKGAVAEVTS
jgi:putative transposase